MEQNRSLTDLPCELISWERCADLARDLAQRILAAPFHPEIIVAIGRGGWMPGRLLSDHLDQPNLASFKVEHYRGPQKLRRALVRYPLNAPVEGLRVLLVDDVSDSGDTFDAALSHLREQGRPAEVRTAVLHHKMVSSHEPDFYAERITRWRWLTYPWALMEDVCELIEGAGLAQAPTEAVLQMLRARYGIDFPPRVARDAQAILARRGL